MQEQQLQAERELVERQLADRHEAGDLEVRQTGPRKATFIKRENLESVEDEPMPDTPSAASLRPRKKIALSGVAISAVSYLLCLKHLFYGLVQNPDTRSRDHVI
jgi:hypothetical protein